jgi:hypothetical protein
MRNFNLDMHELILIGESCVLFLCLLHYYIVEKEWRPLWGCDIVMRCSVVKILLNANNTKPLTIYKFIGKNIAMILILICNYHLCFCPTVFMDGYI